MNLQDEVISKYTRTPDKDILLAMASEILKATPTEKTYREAVVCAAAAYFCDKEQFFEGKPLLLKVIEISNKLVQMVPKNTEYKELYSLYLMMSLANYADMLNHDLLPLVLFRQIPLKSLQLQVLAQPKLHSDWTLQERQTLLIELAKNIQPKEEELLDLARINLAMRYCKIDDREKARDQIKLLLANKPSVARVAADLINYLKTESSTEDVERIAAMLSSDEDKQLNAFYQHCQVRLLFALKRHSQQEDSDLFISFSTGGDPKVKQMIVNSIATASSAEKQLPANSTTQSIETRSPFTSAPTRVPPPAPPVPPPRRSKPEGKAKTMSKKAGAQLMKALHQRSGYAAESPLSEIGSAQKSAAEPAESGRNTKQQPVVKSAESERNATQKPAAASADTCTLLNIMADAMQLRREAIGEHSDSDNEDDVSWGSDDDKSSESAPRKMSESATSQARPLPSAPLSQHAAAAPKTPARSGTRPTIMDIGLFAEPNTTAKPTAATVSTPKPSAGLGSGRQ